MPPFQGPNPFRRPALRPGGQLGKMKASLSATAAQAGGRARREARVPPGFPRTRDFQLKLY